MIIKKTLEKQGYRFLGNSAVKICNWNKQALTDNGYCYKQKFYGIKSHECCQMSCWIDCENKCLHCWRAIELDMKKLIGKKINSPEEIIDNCIKEQRKLLTGFKGNKKINMKKFREAQNPKHFAISLIGEPTLYPKLAELILELRKQGKTSFLVTNGLNPEKLQELARKKSLPTQLYVSLNYPNEDIFRKITRNKSKNAWKRFLQTLKILGKLPTRKVLRMSLVRDLNLGFEKEYAKLIKLAKPDFVEVKGFVSVGFARQRLGYERMPIQSEIELFAGKIAKLTNLKILDKHKASKIVLLGKNKKLMKIGRA